MHLAYESTVVVPGAYAGTVNVASHSTLYEEVTRLAPELQTIQMLPSSTSV